MTRGEARQALRRAGVGPGPVDEDDIKKLRKIISRRIRQPEYYRGTARLARPRANPNFIEIKTDQWKRREAVSFNSDGFVGIAGWASDKNAKPIVDALIEWVTT